MLMTAESYITRYNCHLPALDPPKSEKANRYPNLKPNKSLSFFGTGIIYAC